MQLSRVHLAGITVVGDTRQPPAGLTNRDSMASRRMRYGICHAVREG